MIKLIIAMMISTSMLFLTGCWDRTELNDLSLISAASFDKGSKNRILATVQVIIPQNQGGGQQTAGSGGSGPRATTRSAEGINIADALSKLQRKIPRRLFWGQCKIFIFSEELARNGIREEFDFLVRHPQPRERAYMMISKGKAAEALELIPPIERASSEALREISNLQDGLHVTLEQMSIELKEDAGVNTLPMVYILPPSKLADKPIQTIPYMKGAAILKKGKQSGEITEKLLRGVLLINNVVKDYSITFEVGEEQVSLKPVKTKVRLVPHIDGDNWSMNVKVQSEGSIVQNSTKMNPMKPEELEKMNLAFREDIHHRIEASVLYLQQLKADALRFSTVYHKKYPKEWERVKENWDEQFAKIRVTYDIKTDIKKPGLITTPGGMPYEEVQ
ncbi:MULTISPECIES: Ger(x)C family spore germination protein [unclassified Paenibacillus]|uniref:Ger(x)C family spore germination protein n=1 Tax=unclassified Paenibacillus TaxID=185978 RepID=UPI00104CFA79|nr:MULTISPECIES: Ger(x)C family spore germination protein [unclassified Paenibacillus]NIK66617.1 spore germination protein KC [Paenibacillus sp. BK720]TCN00594.1 spore germination protein KC [Paenibacillus sp. BK033]